MKVWKWDVPTNGIVRDVVIFSAGAAALVVGELLWKKRFDIEQGARSIVRSSASITEAEAIARTYLTQMGVGNVSIVGSDLDGETWTVRARTNGKGPMHVVRINGKSRTVVGWTQSAAD
jgi:hypothetical protein